MASALSVFLLVFFPSYFFLNEDAGGVFWGERRGGGEEGWGRGGLVWEMENVLSSILCFVILLLIVHDVVCVGWLATEICMLQ